MRRVILAVVAIIALTAGLILGISTRELSLPEPVAASPVVATVQGALGKATKSPPLAVQLPVPAAQAPVQAPPIGLDMDEEKRKLVEYYRSEVSKAEAEPREALWAAEFERSVVDSVRAMSADGGHVGSVVSANCRTTKCIVTMEWPDFQLARTNFDWLTTGDASYSRLCAKMVILPEPEDKTVSYSTKLLLDCSSRLGTRE